MKKSFLLYLIMSVFLIGYCACDNDEENFDTATTGQVIKVPDDIKSFNSVTKEIVFEKNISIKQDVLGNEKAFQGLVLSLLRCVRVRTVTQLIRKRIQVQASQQIINSLSADLSDELIRIRIL